MADEPKAGSGRGAARKFAPTVPSRRKKAEDGSAAPSAADSAAANEAFQDLIRAAQSESKWERGRGRGFGRGRGAMAPQMATFGGGDDSGIRPVGRAPAPARIAPGVKQQPGSSTAAKREAKVKLKSDPNAPDSKAAYNAAYDERYEEEEQLGPLFDYSQYYPASLPLTLHHPEDDAADPELDRQIMRQGVPEDLVLQQDDPEHTAEHLGLTDLSAAQDYLYLFQLPAVLPLEAPPKADPADAKGQRRSKASGSAAAAAQQQVAAGIKDLPSGKLGKLLIFQSGKVKMQIGDVLLDVTAGLPCVTRQDVAAVNTSSKHLVQLGPVSQRAVVCPDVWQLMADVPVPQFPRAAAAQQQGQSKAAAVAAANGVHASSDEEDEDAEMSDGDEAAAAAAAVRLSKDAQSAAAAAAAADSVDGMEVDGDGEGGDLKQDGITEEEAAKQRQQEQQQREQAAAAAAPADGALGLLGLTAGAIAARPAARGKGRFMPAAAGRPRAGVKKEGQ